MTSENKPDSQAQSANSAPPGLETDHTKTFTDYLLIIRERIFVGLLFAIIITSIYGYNKYQTVPLYRTRATILFEVDTDRIINIQEVVEDGFGRSPEYSLRNHFTHFKSATFRRRVTESLTDDERELIIKDYRDPESNSDPSVEGIIAGANQISRFSGPLFHIEFHHRNPEAATLLANRFIDQYVEFLLERHRRGNDSAIRFLKAQSEELKLKVELGESEVQNYRKEHNLVSLEESENIVVERMKHLSGALNTAKVSLLQLRTQVDQVQKMLDEEGMIDDLPVINSYGSVADYKNSLKELAIARNTLSIRYLERHPSMIANATQTESIQEKLDAEIERAVYDLNQRYSDQKQITDNIQLDLENAEKDSLELAQIAIDYNVKRRKADHDRRLFDQILQRKNEAMIASQLVDTNLRVVDYAGIPGAPFTPDHKQIITTMVMMFLGAMVGLPIGLAFINSKLKTRSDVEHFIGKELLGEIHKIKKKKDFNVDRVVLDNTDSKINEFFRMLYSHILLLDPAPRTKIFVITSMSPQEGKSFVSSNLAATFSKHEMRTLLIDCDLRQPSLHKGFEYGNEEGVLTWYTDPTSATTGDKSKLGVVPLADNFDFIRAGGSTRAATEVISSEKFGNLIEEFRNTYDVILIDTPPSAVFSDALLLGKMADYYIFTCKQKLHDRRKIKTVIKRLDQSQAKVLGVVFNQTSPNKYNQYGSYYYQYGYYGDYYYQAAGEDTVEAHREAQQKKAAEEEELALEDSQEKETVPEKENAKV